MIPPKQGGSRQRIQHSAGEAQACKKKSELAAYLLLMWSWGMMSTPQIQTIMHKARSDMQSLAADTLDMTDVDMMEGIGSEGCIARSMLAGFFEIVFMLTMGGLRGLGSLEKFPAFGPPSSQETKTRNSVCIARADRRHLCWQHSSRLGQSFGHNAVAPSIAWLSHTFEG